MSKSKTPFSWDDPFALHDQLTDDERALLADAAALLERVSAE